MKMIVSLAVLILLAACADRPQPIRLTGAETRGASDAPRQVTAGFLSERTGTFMELVTADGAVLVGTLRTEREPVAVPFAETGTALIGGGTALAGDLTGAGGAMACRFRLLNPPRGLNGGGSGRCEGQGRQVVFLF